MRNLIWFFPMNRATDKSTENTQRSLERIKKVQEKPCPVCSAQPGEPCLREGLVGLEPVHIAVHQQRAASPKGVAGATEGSTEQD